MALPQMKEVARFTVGGSPDSIVAVGAPEHHHERSVRAPLPGRFTAIVEPRQGALPAALLAAQTVAGVSDQQRWPDDLAGSCMQVRIALPADVAHDGRM